MKKYRKLKNGEKANELEKSIELIIKTKCPTKWIIEDLETGQRYRANGNTEIGKMFAQFKPIIIMRPRPTFIPCHLKVEFDALINPEPLLTLRLEPLERHFFKVGVLEDSIQEFSFLDPHPPE